MGRSGPGLSLGKVSFGGMWTPRQASSWHLGSEAAVPAGLGGVNEAGAGGRGETPRRQQGGATGTGDLGRLDHRWGQRGREEITQGPGAGGCLESPGKPPLRVKQDDPESSENRERGYCVREGQRPPSAGTAGRLLAVSFLFLKRGPSEWVTSHSLRALSQVPVCTGEKWLLFLKLGFRHLTRPQVPTEAPCALSSRWPWSVDVRTHCHLLAPLPEIQGGITTPGCGPAVTCSGQSQGQGPSALRAPSPRL